MRLPSPLAQTVGFDLYKLDRELESYSALQRNAAPLVEYRDTCHLHGSDQVELQALHSFELANEIIGNSRHTDVPAFSPLARAAIAAAEHTNVPVDEDEALSKRGCLEAELRLVRSLAFVVSRSVPESTHRPAAIVFDMDGEPFAYEKSSGLRTAFAWRDAVIVTQFGERFIPGSGWFALQYDDDALLKAEKYQGKGVVSLESATPPEDAVFLRFGTNLLPRLVAHYGHIAATEHASTGASKLHDNLDEAMKLDPSSIASQVFEVLRRGEVVRVKD